MKKLLFLLLMPSCFAYCQFVSPYYPLKQDAEFRAEKPSQLTYYDSGYVQGLFQSFMSDKMGMTMIGDKSDEKNKAFTQIYQDRFSTGKLYITLYWEMIHPKSATSDDLIPEIIKSIKITGTRSRVIDFFISYWTTTMHFKEEDIKADVERNFLQDKIRFFFNNSKPYILITNNAYKTAKEFENYFDQLLKEKK